MTPEAWVAAGGAVVAFITAAIGNAFWVGRKVERVNSKMDMIALEFKGQIDLVKEENEHCSNDRHNARGQMQIIVNQQNELALDMARLQTRKGMEAT